MLIISNIPTKTKVTSYPISISEAREQVNLTSEETDFDTKLTALIPAALDLVENDINSDLLETTNVVTAKIKDQSFDVLQVQCSPLISVSKVEVRKSGKAYTEVDSGTYEAEKGFHYFRIEFDDHMSGYERVRITFTTGYATDDTPKVLKQAALIKIADLFDSENQGYTSTAVQQNTAYDRLINKHIRRYW